MTGKYADQRLEALWDRVDELERVVDRTHAALELGRLTGLPAQKTNAQAGAAIRSVLQQSFKSALLCHRETTDEMLDDWLKTVEEHEVTVGEVGP